MLRGATFCNAWIHNHCVNQQLIVETLLAGLFMAEDHDSLSVRTLADSDGCITLAARLRERLDTTGVGKQVGVRLCTPSS